MIVVFDWAGAFLSLLRGQVATCLSKWDLPAYLGICYRKKEEESNDFPNSVRKKNQFVRAGAEKQSTEWVPVVHKWRHWTDQDLVNSLSFLIQIRKNFFRYWSHAWAVSLLASLFCVRNCPKRFDWIPCFHGPYLCPGTGRHVGLFRAFLGAHLHLLKVGVVAIDRLGHS